MKIRNGFVSNSSSSSFCVLGFHLDESEKNKIAKGMEIPKVEYWGCSECGKRAFWGRKPEFCDKCGGKMQTMEEDGSVDWYEHFDCLGLNYYPIEYGDDVVGFKIDGKTPEQIVEINKKLEELFGEGRYAVLSGEYAC